MISLIDMSLLQWDIVVKLQFMCDAADVLGFSTFFDMNNLISSTLMSVVGKVLHRLTANDVNK